jgi:hypothetical protein
MKYKKNGDIWKELSLSLLVQTVEKLQPVEVKVSKNI